ncbi:carboxypeptidase regulatory-like domain-containing protein [bacterium]|nr:carboxypeptidase regulatory-like domain-containing protein [bacterium]
MNDMPRSRIQALLLAGAVAMAGCELKQGTNGLKLPGAPDGVSQTIPLIEGEVVDASGRPVAGAAVRAYASRYRVEGIVNEDAPPVAVTTDTQGHFVIKNSPLGSVAVEAASQAGLKALKVGVSVAKGAPGAKVLLGTLTVKPTGRIRGTVSATSTGSLLGTDVFIPGTDRVAKTDTNGSYALEDVPEGRYALAAMRPSYAPAVVEGVVVRPNETTRADLQLALDAPKLVSLSATNGASGAEITLNGENFGVSKHKVLQVYFGNTLAVKLDPLSDTTIKVTVPDGATSGGVVLVSDGVRSNPLPFTVISSIAVTPRLVGLYPGDVQQFTAVAQDDRGHVVASPALEWSTSYAGAGTLNPGAVFTATGEGFTRIQATSGKLFDRAAVTSTPYRLETIAGNGTLSSFGDGGSALTGSFALPLGLAASPDGQTLYVSEVAGKRTVRAISSDNLLSTFAGGGTEFGDDAPPTSAQLTDPRGLAVDADGGLAISDAVQHRIRYVPTRDQIRFGLAMKANRIYTIAGTGVSGSPREGEPGTKSNLTAPLGLAFGRNGNLYFTSSVLNQVYRLDPSGRLYLVAGSGGTGGNFTQAPSTSAPIGSVYTLAIDTLGNLVIGGWSRIYFDCREPGTYFGIPMASGSLYPLIGGLSPGDGPDGKDLANLRVSQVRGLAFDAENHLWFTDDNHVIRRLSPDGTCVTVAGARREQGIGGAPGHGVNAGAGFLTLPASVLPRPDGRVLFVDGSNQRVALLIPRHSLTK